MPHPESIAVILNVSAGTAQKHPNLDADVADLFRASGCDAEIVRLPPGQDPADAARAASARAAIVVAGGGDGTISGVAAGIVESRAALGVLPLGTLNHFARDLHIPTDLRQAVEVIAARHLARVDVGQVNDRVFLNNSSIGLYPNIVEERERLRRQGYRKWPAMAIATLRVVRRYRGVAVRTSIDGRQRIWRTPFALVANNEYTIEGLGLGARSRLDQGTLLVYLAPRSRARDLPMLIAGAMIGRASLSGAFEIVATTELTIETRSGAARRIRVALDGEVVTMSTPLRYRMRPLALQVAVPRT
jgi:diacylglycerol kinase family enzyme